jgi:5-methyltetrahydrofolate--homocysteine methyltransferase
MDGLDLAKKIVDKDAFAKFRAETEERRRALADEAAPAAQPIAPKVRSKEVEPLPIVPDPPYLDRRIDKSCPVDIVWRYVNPRMLYGRHLGLRGNVLRLLEEGETQQLRQTEAGRKALELADEVTRLKDEIRRKKLIKPKAVWQFLPAESEGNDLRILSEDRKRVRATFTFPRQARENGLSLSDYVNPKGGGAPDHVAAFVVTAGEGVRELSEKWKNEGAYLKSHLLQALALESAEGYAEYLHSQFRGLWGFADEPDTSMLSLFQARYRGKRYSFGYPACPRLDDQAPLFELLKPEEIGVSLTDGFMMDPEASVSALVFHHPEASYFSVGQLAIDAAADELGEVVPRVRRTGS